MSDRVFSERSLPFTKVRTKAQRKVQTASVCKKESLTKKAVKTAAKVAISAAISGDVSGAVADSVVGGILDKV